MRPTARNIPRTSILERLRYENPWWAPPHRAPEFCLAMKPRAYLGPFSRLVGSAKARRAVVLMGPRRVGKTVLIFHLVDELLRTGASTADRACYVSVDHPLYNGLGLEELAGAAAEAAGASSIDELQYLFFDEIQYMRDWERHLKSFVDAHRTVQVVASGSAAAALKLKSIESGAGRFTDFMLPPLTFYEFVEITGRAALVRDADLHEAAGAAPACDDIAALNACFLEYLNFGGYPELALDPEIRADPGRFIRNDIIDKVLLRDLPGLYGIQDIQELNHLFTSLAYNTANEVSLETLSTRSGVAKNTIKKYIEYLEAAFLIRRLSRVDRRARRFRREWSFRVYLTNPSMWGALFSPVTESSQELGDLVESAILAQWFHGARGDSLRYARWDSGEVDLVGAAADGTPLWAVEVKWSDRPAEHDRELRHLLSFADETGIAATLVTTRTVARDVVISGRVVHFRPTSLYCYTLGRNLLRGRDPSSGTLLPG